MAYQTINRFTEKLVKSFKEHTDAQLEAIVARAQASYKNDWSLRSLAKREAIIKKAASIMREKLDEFAKPIMLEMGKLFRGGSHARSKRGWSLINRATWTAPDLPFGGVKNSGYGRELSDLGIGEFVNKKLIRVA
jgi:acyl-CoA reductase-like NAD-dependent aldehyde dehydrogenase